MKDRGWLLRMSLYLALMVGLIWYGAEKNPAVTLRMCLNAPETHDGARIDVGSETTIVSLSDSSFVIQQQDDNVQVVGPPDSNASINDFVTLVGRFSKPDTLILESMRVAEKRRYKIGLSVIPALGILIFFFTRFKFSKHGLRER